MALFLAPTLKTFEKGHYCIQPIQAIFTAYRVALTSYRNLGNWALAQPSSVLPSHSKLRDREDEYYFQILTLRVLLLSTFLHKISVPCRLRSRLPTAFWKEHQGYWGSHVSVVMFRPCSRRKRTFLRGAMLIMVAGSFKLVCIRKECLNLSAHFPNCADPRPPEDMVY